MRRAIQLFGLLGCTTILAGQSVEQTSEDTRGTVTIVTQFDGLGVGFEGPQGTATLRNPSDNSLAVGPNHVVQIVNTMRDGYPRAGRGCADLDHALAGLHSDGMDPSDDCTIWYVGDYVKKDASSYSSRVGAFRIPGCTR